MRRLVTVALLGFVLVTVPAAAHAELVASTPAANASLAAPPARLELTFDEPVTLRENPLEVIGPGNATWKVGKATLDGPVLSAPVTASGPEGTYTLVYRVVSDDGDPVSGSVRFTLTAAAGAPAEPTVTPSRTPPSAAGGGTLLWVWLVAGAVLLAALVFVTLRVRRPGR